MMNVSDAFEQMFCSVFAPKKDEKVVFLYDLPTDQVSDNLGWRERRMMVEEWVRFSDVLGRKIGFTIDTIGFPATGRMNAPLPSFLMDQIKEFNIVLALTEFSATSSLLGLVRLYPDSLRCASMPLVEKRMMDTVLAMDYSQVRKHAHGLKSLLDKATRAEVIFDSGDTLSIDLRNRNGGADDGDCTFPGACINLPSGEGFIAPYEAWGDEQEVFGRSETNGVLPLMVHDNLMRCTVEENMITEISGNDFVYEELIRFFDEYEGRRNIAELGIGCNPRARITGNVIEDEKVGVHIAYGTSSHIGGRITSDVHQDIVYAKDCPVVAEIVVLLMNDTTCEIVKNGAVQYGLIS